MKRSKPLRIFLTVVGIAAVALLLLPLAVTVAGSVMSRVDLGFYYFGRAKIEYFKFVPDNFTLSQYYDALIGNTDYTRAFLNSVEYSVISTALAMVIAIPAAYSLAFCDFPLKRIVVAVYLLLMILPYQSVEIPHYLLLREAGLLGSDAAVIVTNIFDTFEICVLAVLFMSIPRETMEAAEIDGAGTLRKITSVALPQTRAGVLTTALLKFVNAWNLTEQPLVFLEDPTRYPLSVLLPTLNGRFRTDSFAFSVVFILPPMLLYFGMADELEEFVGGCEVKG